MDNKKYVRFIVNNPNENISASYNTALGNNAYLYAVQNASRFFGKIIGQLEDGQYVELKNFSTQKSSV